MSDDFYRALEDKFRGSRELIKSRLQFYLPFVQPLLNFYPSAKAIDLGCGRGEWLEVLADNGFDAEGVDLDDDMLAACRECGLNVQTNDALAFLRGMPDQSRVIVSGFQGWAFQESANHQAAKPVTPLQPKPEVSQTADAQQYENLRLSHGSDPACL